MPNQYISPQQRKMLEAGLQAVNTAKGHAEHQRLNKLAQRGYVTRSFYVAGSITYTTTSKGEALLKCL